MVTLQLRSDTTDGGLVAVSHELSVSPEGLDTASAALHEQARLITTTTDGAAPTGNKPSSAGAATFAVALDTFASAYANRMSKHGRAVRTAAASYTSIDGGAATNISAVSI